MQIRARPALAGLAFAVAFIAPAPHAGAQQQGAARQLTVERIFNDPSFRLRGLPAVQWMRDGTRFTFVQADDAGVTHLVAEDARTGTRTRLVDGSRLVPAGATSPIEIEDYTWSADERRLVIFTETQPVWRQNTKGKFYVFDVAEGRLTPASTRPGWQQFAKLSPDGTRIGFVRDHDLWVTELASGRETRLTRDGSADIINGTFDWVYEEELGLQDGWRWSPDGARIAFWRLDQSPVRTFTMIRETDSLYSRPMELKYPKAGTANSIARIGVYDLSAGTTTWVDTGSNPDVYLARMEWAASPAEIMVQRLNRHQNRLEVLLADARTGRSRVTMVDTDSAWVDVDDDLTYIRGGRQFLWSSERDGYNHLYLHDRDGRMARQLTRGPWEVTALYGVDEAAGWVYFQGTREGPQQKHLYRVRLGGGDVQKLSGRPGTHAMELSPGTPFYIQTRSRAGMPPVYTLHRTSGEQVRLLEDNAHAASALAALDTRLPEFFTFRTQGGVDLNGWMIKPKEFDASKKYPVLVYVYGGPGSQTVTDAWGGPRYLWHQLLAQRGYVVVSVDNRGTGGRGAAFKKSVYLSLGEKETADQVAAGQWLARQPWVDASRLGIWGWSYGGYMSSLTMMRPGHPYKAGIAVAPVTDWDLYDTIYTERFLRTPQENPGGYRNNAPASQAANLKGDLLVIHGTLDDNVHFQNSIQLVDALQAAGKQFDFMAYPDRNHSIAGGRSVHLYTYMTNWLTENL